MPEFTPWNPLGLVRSPHILPPDAWAASIVDNGNFGISQLAAVDAWLVSPDGGYSALDRFYTLWETDLAASRTRRISDDFTPISGFAMEIEAASGGKSMVVQPIEFANVPRGQHLTIEATIRPGVTGDYRLAILEQSSVTPDALVNDIVADWANPTFTPGNFYSAAANLFATPTSPATSLTAAGSRKISLSTTTPIDDTTTNLYLCVICDHNTATPWRLEALDCHVGRYFRDFQPKSQAAEAIACFRESYVPINNDQLVYAYSNTTIFHDLWFPVPMRANPTLLEIGTIGTGVTIQVYYTATTNPTAVVHTRVNKEMAFLNWTVPAGGWANLVNANVQFTTLRPIQYAAYL